MCLCVFGVVPLDKNMAATRADQGYVDSAEFHSSSLLVRNTSRYS
jgi:hypothetical protein